MTKYTIAPLILAASLGMAGCTAAQKQSAEQLIVQYAPQATAQGAAALAKSLQPDERAKVCTNLQVLIVPFCAAPAPTPAP